MLERTAFRQPIFVEFYNFWSLGTVNMTRLTYWELWFIEICQKASILYNTDFVLHLECPAFPSTVDHLFLFFELTGIFLHLMVVVIVHQCELFPALFFYRFDDGEVLWHHRNGSHQQTARYRPRNPQEASLPFSYRFASE